MKTPDMRLLNEERGHWSRVIAFAWTYNEVLNDLRKDPKETIIELAKGKDSTKYQNVDDDNTAFAAGRIQIDAEDNPEEAYSGYLPLPNPLVGLECLDQSQLAALLRAGIDGILKFEAKADLWAEVLFKAWKDPKGLLVGIRKDPLQYLRKAITVKNTQALQQSEYGILPIPNRPKSLEKFKIEDLREFLIDQDIMENLGGIFLFGS